MDQAKLPQRRSIRMEGYDYAQAGAYFITIRAHERRSLFGRIDAAEMRPNALGIIVEEEWYRSAQIRSTIALDAFVFMPNHLHGIVIITSDVEATGRSPARRQGPARGSLGSLVGSFKAAVTRRRAGAPAGEPLWQRNYYEHIIRGERELEQIREYVTLNPAQWASDRQNPDRTDGAKRVAVWDW